MVADLNDDPTEFCVCRYCESYDLKAGVCNITQNRVGAGYSCPDWKPEPTWHKDREVIKSKLTKDFCQNVLQLLALRQRGTATEEIVKHILTTEHIYTLRSDEKVEMWIYKDGIYLPAAQTYIKAVCREVVGSAYTPQLSNDIIAKICTDTYIEPDFFFTVRNPLRFCVANGIFDLKTCALESFNPGEFHFTKIPINYAPEAKCDRILKFMNEVVSQEDVGVLQEVFGHFLVRDYIQAKAVMCHGSGRNGKSRLLELMKRFLGLDNCSNITLQQIEEDNFA
ncbi:MAG: hypothetical protein EHM12_10960, partial [Dehalococcoidia bacterium]